MKRLARRYRRRNRCEPCCFSRYVRIVGRTAFAVVNNIYSIPAYVFWIMALRLIKPLIGPIYWKIEGFMFHWLLAMVSMWSWTAGYEIVESGDEPAACSGYRTLVLANHQSTGDVPTLMSAWNPRIEVLPNLMWIMDHVFKYTNFGIVSVLHRDFFIRAGRDRREQSLEELRHHIHETYVPLHRNFLVLFPEGGFLHKRKEISHRFAEKNNLPKLENVSLPRSGAMQVIMEEIGPRPDAATTSNDDQKAAEVAAAEGGSKLSYAPVQPEDRLSWVLDVTLAYQDRVPLHLQDVVCGTRDPCTTHIHYRLYPASEVPQDSEGMTKWLYERFIEKDALLEEFYRTGQFPRRGDSGPRPVRQDLLKYLILHLFFLTSTYVQLRLICLILSFIW